MDLKLRLIPGRPKCPTGKVSNFMDILLKPSLNEMPSFAKDLLNQCQREPEHKNVTAMFVVVIVYLIILHELGMQTVSYFLNNFPVTCILDF